MLGTELGGGPVTASRAGTFSPGCGAGPQLSRPRRAVQSSDSTRDPAGPTCQEGSHSGSQCQSP